MKGLAFWKMTGAGNDFVALDASLLEVPRVGPEAAAALCDRHRGVGADGLLLVGVDDSGAAVVEYRNADGSAAAFCGNGARCAARFAVLRGLTGERLLLRFAGAAIPARVDGDEVAIEVPRPEVLGTRTVAIAGFGEVPVATVEAGVEHLVVDESDSEGVPLGRLAEAFGRAPDEVNQTAYRRDGEGRARVRTVERGSGETLACGSAALAVAALASRDEALVVVPPAGVPLTVRTPRAPAPFTLEGEGRVLFEGTFRAAGPPLDR